MDTVERIYERGVTGRNLIAGAERGAGRTWSPQSPATGEPLPGEFHEATEDEVASAVTAATDAFRDRWSHKPEGIAALLAAAADELQGDTEQLLTLVHGETGLSTARVQRELTRTIEQFRFFAAEVEDGAYVEATISLADPDAPGGPRPDMRRMLVPLGPVGVFGASNFPLAYSVAGGDTASALAAGCPVIVKAHPAHPGTSEVCARAILRAVEQAGLPASWFSMVQGQGNDVGRWLVTAPDLTAVGFTGSLKGGRALHDLGAGRERPIPVYAEMGSLNPLFITRGAMRARSQQIGEALVGSITTDGGQFCTKSGLVFVPDTAETKQFTEAVASGVAAADPGVLVSDRIRQQLRGQMEALDDIPGVTVLAASEQDQQGGFDFPATVLQCSLETFLETPELSLEHFGPVSVIVTYDSDENLLDVARRFEGTLTSTVHAEEDESALAQALRDVVAQRSGRVVWNGMPTGLAVAHATHHGGPFPATTNPLHTSVGATSIRRWLRPVSYQATPGHLLPQALQDDNALGLWRNVDGERTRAPISASA